MRAIVRARRRRKLLTRDEALRVVPNDYLIGQREHEEPRNHMIPVKVRVVGYMLYQKRQAAQR
jgi:hypothetical protein